MNSLKSKIQTMVVCFLLITSQLFSATITINGKVVDENNNPISEVNIYSGTIGTESQIDGSFTLTVDDQSIVSYSHIGFNDISIKASSSKGIIKMKPSILNGKEIIVNAEFGNQYLFDSPSSISLLNNKELEFRNENHFQNVIDVIPNLNFSSGTSRPRYFQIRGIGERSQYTGEGAPNFSVGYMIDGIDFSGIGMTGMLFDTKQIEVFKGPQSSIYGPNAMAGLINITTADPTPFYTGKSLISIGSDNLQTYGLAFGGPIVNNLTFRLAFQKHNQDGFRENVYRNLTDTNKRDEIFYRAKLHWTITPNISLTTSNILANLNNGYDTWAVDNNVDFITYSDEQGMDSQKTNASTVKLDFSNFFGANAFYQYTSSNNEMEHSYDGDWANNDYWLEEPYNFDPGLTYWEYKFYDKTISDRKVDSHELRISADFANIFSYTFGYYLSKTNETDDASGWLLGGAADMLNSEFILNNRAIYTQISSQINQFNYTLNLRSETQNTVYSSTGLIFDWDENDYMDLPKIKNDINHSFLGGKFAISYEVSKLANVFASVSKGYKAGGINQNPNLSGNSRFYDPEYNTNFEVGAKINSDFVSANITFFSMSRTDQQVQISSQQEDGNPNSFYFYTSNASNGTNTGAEFDAKLKLMDGLIFRTSVGILKTQIDAYDFWIDDSTMTILGNREQAMAPLYNFALGLNYQHASGLFADIELTGKDEYYFSDSHNQKSDAYQLLNLTAGYSYDKWSISLWGKNILDKRYATRGFYFGNEPIWNEEEGNHDNPDKLYVSYGDPLHFGMTVKYQF